MTESYKTLLETKQHPATSTTIGRQSSSRIFRRSGYIRFDQVDQRKIRSGRCHLHDRYGQREDLSAIGERAKKIGAVAHYQIDAKEEFVRDYIFKSIKANGMYQGVYPISTALARPLLAEKVVEVAQKVGAVAVVTGPPERETIR